MSAVTTLTPMPSLVSYDLDDRECFEIIDGLRVEIPPMSAEATVIAADLSHYLTAHGFSNELGRGVVEGLFHLPLPMDRNRRPDVAFVPFSRWPKTKRIPTSNAWDVLPDIVAEVISPSDRFEEVFDKIEEYFQSGIQLVWVIHPGLRRVYIFASPTEIRVLTRNDALNGGVVLPGFQLPLAQLFPADV